MSVAIEFENDSKLGRLEITSLNSTGRNFGTSFLEWDMNVNSSKTDSIISLMGWNRNTLHNLKRKLDEANCIGIESGEPAKIGFKRSGMGMYFFNVFDSALTDSIRKQFSDTCAYIIASDHLILEYGGGAVGPQCFYNK